MANRVWPVVEEAELATQRMDIHLTMVVLSATLIGSRSSPQLRVRGGCATLAAPSRIRCKEQILNRPFPPSKWHKRNGFVVLSPCSSIIVLLLLLLLIAARSCCRCIPSSQSVIYKLYLYRYGCCNCKQCLMMLLLGWCCICLVAVNTRAKTVCIILSYIYISIVNNNLFFWICSS